MRTRGFTLIEIVLALMIVALGLLAVFQLFPSGLRASYDATVETRLTQFADEVFGGMRAQATGVTDPAQWSPAREVQLARLLVSGLPPTYRLTQAVQDPDNPPLITVDKYPALNGEALRYQLVVRVNATNLASAWMVARYGKIGGEQREFYTEFYNMGSMP